MSDELQDEVLRALAARRGHFALESGHHGELWLDLELLCLDPAPVQRFALALARRLAAHRVELVCGPLVEGAFVALLAALELGVPFAYTERSRLDVAPGLYPFAYLLPPQLREQVRGRRVAIANDVINAGSAVGGTHAELEACGARVVAIGTLAVLGDWTDAFCAAHGLALETLARMPNRVWAPAECPQCARGEPIE